MTPGFRNATIAGALRDDLVIDPGAEDGSAAGTGKAPSTPSTRGGSPSRRAPSVQVPLGEVRTDGDGPADRHRRRRPLGLGGRRAGGHLRQQRRLVRRHLGRPGAGDGEDRRPRAGRRAGDGGGDPAQLRPGPARRRHHARRGLRPLPAPGVDRAAGEAHLLGAHLPALRAPGRQPVGEPGDLLPLRRRLAERSDGSGVSGEAGQPRSRAPAGARAPLPLVPPAAAPLGRSRRRAPSCRRPSRRTCRPTTATASTSPTRRSTTSPSPRRSTNGCGAGRRGISRRAPAAAPSAGDAGGSPLSSASRTPSTRRRWRTAWGARSIPGSS